MTAANPSCEKHVLSARKRRGEPTLDDILAGPIVRALMAADRVDAQALNEMLGSIASRLRDRTGAARAARPSALTRRRALSEIQQGRRRPVAVEIAAL